MMNITTAGVSLIQASVLADEAILLYVLAMGSPTHPIVGDCYKAWTATYQWENLYNHDYLYAGPLFVHHFSHAWIDFRGIRDRFMREKRSDYFENSRRAVYIHREYAQRNPTTAMLTGELSREVSATNPLRGFTVFRKYSNAARCS